MSFKLDDKDLAILVLIQENSKLTANQIAKKTNTPITTVFAKIKRMEDLGIIKQYRAIIAPEKLNLTTAAFILAAVSYGNKPDETLITQRGVAEEIAKFFEVQEVHIITGDWDLLIKIRAESVNTIGNFVVDKLRRVNGLQKTLTCMIFETIKETTTCLPVNKSFSKETLKT
ncbi:MAG: Lrp/AsnC family transcriptional regulator [Nitrososphaerota archaeon]|jgi:DNA-binding Lrp family transcriptional regulator|uniref:Lrp/AsnC family transcriptional regulator n=1 Tax=Candidatus Bathycorpusculum sp. TaxID=2994959 RepID=UPI00281810EC|nr:Lrp/AsnC family transcriptional regulator [Candidatus Termiticorpusculum sp.]MCL2257587.1 Lrp/AsnC family transcriptional regulator [Candidatus Termiticorpusculum sp.]MCL2292275.1 Lrp/AsnC family transcriptional regulator [Candidatus Termiticorpusculum sp.]MDR0460208.1 Lrp/AsnC family transcriptional regulator [Nitrososphaerota archaeon]